MAKAIKVTRSGIHRIFKKKVFRQWLDDQPRKDLTYMDPSARLATEIVAKGWTTEDFIRECWKRGLDVRIGTVLNWSSGAKPRPFFAREMQKHFKTIQF